MKRLLTPLFWTALFLVAADECPDRSGAWFVTEKIIVLLAALLGWLALHWLPAARRPRRKQ